MSGWGTGVFELGIVGVGLIVAVSWVIISPIRRDPGRIGLYVLILMCAHMAMLNATPLAFPPFPFLIGICAVFARKPAGHWPGSQVAKPLTNGALPPGTMAAPPGFG